jgi:hypothetical protein
MVSSYEHSNETSGSVRGGKFVYPLSDSQFLKTDPIPRRIQIILLTEIGCALLSSLEWSRLGQVDSSEGAQRYHKNTVATVP